MTVWQRQQDWVGSEVEDHYVMIHIDSGRYMSLNHTAAAAWHALETPRSRDEIVATLIDRFRIDADDCARSVDAMLARMAGMDLIAPAA